MLEPRWPVLAHYNADLAYFYAAFITTAQIVICVKIKSSGEKPRNQVYVFAGAHFITIPNYCSQLLSLLLAADDRQLLVVRIMIAITAVSSIVECS